MNRKYRKTMIAGNWKMNLLPSDVKPYADALKALTGRRKWCEAAVCVPSVMLVPAVRAFRGSRIQVGAQDVSAEPAGARTGEVSAAQLKDAGAKLVIVGHSERRQYHGETDELVARKLRAVLDAELTPILCVGETLPQRETGLAREVVRLQLKTALFGLPPEKLKKTVIAYEPIWAIGTGRTATPAEAQEMCAEIRALARELYGARVARAVTVLYGGSMSPDNALGLLSQPDVDGGLIGGASLDAAKFYRIMEAANV